MKCRYCGNEATHGITGMLHGRVYHRYECERCIALLKLKKLKGQPIREGEYVESGEVSKDSGRKAAQSGEGDGVQGSDVLLLPSW